MIGNYWAKYERVSIWPTIDFNTKKAKTRPTSLFFRRMYEEAIHGLHSVNFKKQNIIWDHRLRFTRLQILNGPTFPTDNSIMY
jgi:hypothetical protein